MKILVTLWLHGSFCLSNFVYLYILTLSRHWHAKRWRGFVEHQSGRSWLVIVKMLITLVPHGIFCSKFAYLYILTLSGHWYTARMPTSLVWVLSVFCFFRFLWLLFILLIISRTQYNVYWVRDYIRVYVMANVYVNLTHRRYAPKRPWISVCNKFDFFKHLVSLVTGPAYTSLYNNTLLNFIS